MDVVWTFLAAVLGDSWFWIALAGVGFYVQNRRDNGYTFWKEDYVEG